MCRLGPAAYLALYETAGEQRGHREAIDARLDDLDANMTSGDLAEAYRRYWRALTDPASMVASPESAMTPLAPVHGQLASWLIAPLRTTGDSTELGNRAQAAAQLLVGRAGITDQEISIVKIGVAGWTVGQVYGGLDRSIPLVPATEIPDPDLALAYAGLLEHSAVFASSSWSEIAGSAVFWRVGGVAEALRPESSLQSSLSRLMSDVGNTCPLNVRRQMDNSELASFVGTRNAFTHVRGNGSLGLADVHDLARDRDLVIGLVRAATHFVCGDLSYKAAIDYRYGYWGDVLEQILEELRRFDDFLP